MPQFLFARLLTNALRCAPLMVLSAMPLRAQTSAPPAAAPAPSAPAYREITDEMARPIRVPQPVRRIVSLAPSLTETIYALGLQDLLVGDTDYCDFPPEARHKPKVGGAINPSLEAIVALRPDLVLVTKSLNRLDTVTSLAELGIPSYATDPHTIEGIISSTQRLANALGAPEAGEMLATDLQRRLAETRQRVASFPQRRVLFVIWTSPLISIGKDTFIADALQYAGATSIVDSKQAWPQVNLEEVVRLQPDFLVFAETHSEAAPANPSALSALPGWRALDAVRNHRFAITSDAVNRPAPSIVSAVEDLAKQFHPEAFSEKAPEEKDKNDKPNTSPPNPPPFSSSLLRFSTEDSSILEACACVH